MSQKTSEELRQEVEKRRTFAIISHPDAGKTTLTEKLLLYGGAIHTAGSVKARKAARHATSDWMEIEKQRGISVTSSVMQFQYEGKQVNILDTPGHQDFSEDTYRTLTAADSAVMLIDVAKGVEAQTIKLFQVCSKRGIPIFTFINKLDREGQDPFELLEEIERVLGIRSVPMNWPIGMGRELCGVYDRMKSQVELFQGKDHSKIEVRKTSDYNDPVIREMAGDYLAEKLAQELELLDVAGDEFDYEKVRTGQLTPVFFGSAVNNFGVQTFLENFLELAPQPTERKTADGTVAPEEEKFSGYVFKIQANMNPAHRDRIAFLRICSGKFQRGMSVRHVRAGKEINVVAIIEEGWRGEGWSEPGDARHLAQHFRGAADDLAALIARGQNWTRWCLSGVDARGPWQRGRVALIGDAAHAMLPFLAQGAAMAIEDAAVLTRQLLRPDLPAEIALERYVDERRPRAARVSDAARQSGAIYHMSPLAAPFRDATMKALGGERLLARYDWLYGWRQNG